MPKMNMMDFKHHNPTAKFSISTPFSGPGILDYI